MMNKKRHTSAKKKFKLIENGEFNWNLPANYNLLTGIVNNDAKIDQTPRNFNISKIG